MVRSWIRLLLAGLLVACTFPFFAISFLIAALGSALAALFPRFDRRRSMGECDLPWAADEFRFDRAIESYEALIDAHAAHAWRQE